MAGASQQDSHSPGDIPKGNGDTDTTLPGPASQPWLQLSPATLGNESTAVDGNWVKYQPPAHPPPTLQGLQILTAED